MTAASPLEVLWAVDGRPPLPSANTAGVCAATGAQADVVPLKAGLPSSFNSQHLLRFAGPTAGVSASMHHAMTTWGPVRCADSRWKNSGLMALVIDDHNVTEVTRSATGSTYGPLDPDDPLPWDFVVTHHDRGFLVDRWRKRQAFLNQQVARR